MRIEVRARCRLSDGVRRRAERSLRLALSRFAEVVESVTVRLRDANGPRGGVDKECAVSARLRRRGTLRVEHRHEELKAALDGAADRIGRMVARRLERFGGSRRRLAMRIEGGRA